jgi:hypothetical protein
MCIVHRKNRSNPQNRFNPRSTCNRYLNSKDRFAGANDRASMDEWLVAQAREWRMIGFRRAGRGRAVSFVVGIGLVATGWGVLAPPPVVASPIKGSHHRYEAVDAEREAARSWSAYLLAGPKLWSSVIHPSVTPEVRNSIWHALRTDAAETNPWVHFLLWKQSLDPARFARNHPHVAPVLNRISTVKVVTPVTQTSSTPGTGTPVTSTPLTQPQTIAPAVPEPGAWLLAVGMTGWGLWRRRRRS